MLVHNGGCTRVSAFEKAYFQILFFSQKKGKKGNPRIEFSPANKKETRTCSIQKFFTELKKNSTKFQNILCVSVAKRGDFASCIIVFSRVFHGQKITKKNSFYNFPNEKRRFCVFITPLTLPLTSLTLTFRIWAPPAFGPGTAGLPKLFGSVCVECLIGKQKKPILFKVTEPSSVPYRAPSACAKWRCTRTPHP
jgi:hypothetical protein